MAFVKRGNGNVFLQIDPTVVMEYITSTGVGDVATPGRPRTIKYDPDVSRSGEFVPTEFIHGEPGEVTAPFVRPLDTVNNYLQELVCPFVARINWACRGDRSIPWNYELAMLMIGGEFEGGSTGQPVINAPADEDRVMTNGDMKALLWSYIYLLTGVQQTVADAEDIYDIWFLPEECGDRCGNRVLLGCEGYAVRASGGYLTGDNVIYTDDCGTDSPVPWPETAADPFLGSKDGLCVITVETSTGHRIIVGGGAEVGVAAEISYSDTGGAAWNDVTVGATNNQSINKIVQDRRGRLWAAASAGFVYMSNDIGQSWSIMHSATLTAEDLNDIVFVDENLGFAVGDNNDVIYTPDAGNVWALLTGPAAGVDLNTISANRYTHIYVGDDNGDIWRSTDDGVVWVRASNPGAGSVTRLRFDSKLGYVGYATWNNAAGVGSLLRSEDGGVSWMAWTTPTNTGLNSLFICDPNMVYVCGNAGFIGKFVRSAS